MKRTCSLFVFWFTTALVHAEGNWLTLAGYTAEETGDYVQFDPSGIKRQNETTLIPVRVSGKLVRTTPDGIVFRSVTGTAAIKCKQRTATLLRASFYAEADFRGVPFQVREVGPEIGPMTFRDADAERARQIFKAACRDSPPASLP